MFDDYTELLDELLSEENKINLNVQINNVYFHPSYRFKDKDNQVQFVFDEFGQILGTSDEVTIPIDYAR